MPDKTEQSTQEPEERETDIQDMIRRVSEMLIAKRWVLASVAVTVAFATIAYTLTLPDRYTSEATIFAVQQRVPERYVLPTSTADPSQALEAMVQEVLSRPRLLAVIEELGLHPEQRKRLKPEELLELVRRDLKVEPVTRMLGRGEVNVFKIAFVAETPHLAQAVTQRLTTLFIEQNLKARADQATMTSQFLHEQLEATRNDLEAQEQRLRDFKMQYIGELPEQQQGNIGILTGLQSQLDAVVARRSQARQQRLYLESLLGEYARRPKRSSGTLKSSTGESLTPLEAAESDLSRLRAEKRALLINYTPRHPEVEKKDKEIALQQTMIDTLKTAKPASPAKYDAGADEPSDTEQGTVVAQLRSQLSANKLELDDLTSKEQKLRVDITTYESRLSATPIREQQLTSIQRDYDLLKQHYADLLKKEQDSQLATDLENRQEGQRFRLAEPPSLPTVPSSPKRLKISLLGLLGGFVLGGVVALVLDIRNTSLRSEDDAKRRFELPLVIGIPVVRTPTEERALSRRRILEWVAASLLVAVVAVAEMYVYRRG
jgi:succinoglycan biosynthesis transport protein ExoP